TGSSSRGKLKSLTSTSSNSASVRFLVSSKTHLATDSPTRPGRVLPMMMAIFSMAGFLENRYRCPGHDQLVLHLPFFRLVLFGLSDRLATPILTFIEVAGNDVKVIKHQG